MDGSAMMRGWPLAANPTTPVRVPPRSPRSVRRSGRVADMGSRERFRQRLAEAPAEVEAIEHDERWFTWGQLRDVAESLQTELVGLGDAALRVGVILENRPEHVASLIALITWDHRIVQMISQQPPPRLYDAHAASRVPGRGGN